MVTAATSLRSCKYSTLFLLLSLIVRVDGYQVTTRPSRLSSEQASKHFKSLLSASSQRGGGGGGGLDPLQDSFVLKDPSSTTARTPLTTAVNGSGTGNSGGGVFSSQYISSDTYLQDGLPSEKRPWIHLPDYQSVVQLVLPLTLPLVAYLSYDLVAQGFSFFIDGLSDNNWIAVDGGAYQAKIIAPAINGVVMPAVAVLFATLTSTTISSLRQRQVSIRRCINLEAGELRVLEDYFTVFSHGLVKERCRTYLIQYTSRILAECDPKLGPAYDVVNPRRSMDSEMNAILHVLNEHASEIAPHLAQGAYQSIHALRKQRQDRVTALQSTYPALHYVLLAGAAMAECIGFLMESNQDVLVFLNAVQLKLLWSMLVGTFTACFTVFYDLRSPFSGSYQISASVDQLYTIRSSLRAAQALDKHYLEEDNDDEGDGRSYNGDRL